MKTLKIITILFFFSQLTNCKGQKKDGVTYPNEKIMTMEKFDVDKLNKCLIQKEKENPLQDLSTCDELLKDGSFISNYETTEGYVSVHTLPIPSLLQNYKEYYDNSILKEEFNLFIGLAIGSDQVKFGISKYYDETGQLVKIIDESVKYKDLKIKPLDLFEILKKEPLFVFFNKEEQAHFKYILQLSEKENEINPITVMQALKKTFLLNPYDREDTKKVFLTLREDEKSWFVIKDIYPFGRIELDVDTSSGKITNRKYTKETRP